MCSIQGAGPDRTNERMRCRRRSTGEGNEWEKHKERGRDNDGDARRCGGNIGPLGSTREHDKRQQKILETHKTHTQGNEKLLMRPRQDKKETCMLTGCCFRLALEKK